MEHPREGDAAAMTDALGWPGEPGFPLNPERDGWHWIDERALEWEAERRWWHYLDMVFPPDDVPGEKYLGPCLMPAEIAQREREAELRGWEQTIEFFQELDVPPDHREYAATLKALLAELARRRAE